MQRLFTVKAQREAIAGHLNVYHCKPCIESKGLCIRSQIFSENDDFRNTLFKKKNVFNKVDVYTETLETTKNDVVPMPGLV